MENLDTITNLEERGFIPVMFDEIEQSTRYLINKSGDVFDTVYGKFILKQFVGGNRKNGKYLGVNMWLNDGRRTVLYIHRLVAFTFLPLVQDKNEINHIDLDKTNNHVDNLEWSTRAENMQHYFSSNEFKTKQAKRQAIKQLWLKA